jgi:hypothetical protein
VTRRFAAAWVVLAACGGASATGGGTDGPGKGTYGAEGGEGGPDSGNAETNVGDAPPLDDAVADSSPFADDTGTAPDSSLPAPEAGPPEGTVHFVKRMGDPSFDSVVTQPSPATVTWLVEHFYRMEVFSTFFDDKTSWYPNGLVYSDSAVIYPGSTTATSHPDWILEDPSGNPVYLDWNCSNGTCPQYAADVSNPGFQSYWIGALRATLAKGYLGAWIDDVNLALRFSNGTTSVTAHSPTSSTVMTEDAWSAAVASFMTAVRAALPGYELLHNSIWYARPTRTADACVQQEIAAADVINMEGGFASDSGLTGGTGDFSVYAKMAFADAVHALGRWVVVDDFPANDADRQYALACYLLLTNGKDGLGDASMAPSTWWSGYDVTLGSALGARTRSAAGLFRRDFDQGLVLMLEPGAASTTVTLPGAYRTLDGTTVTEVALTARQGVVLVAM